MIQTPSNYSQYWIYLHPSARQLPVDDRPTWWPPRPCEYLQSKLPISLFSELCFPSPLSFVSPRSRLRLWELYPPWRVVRKAGSREARRGAAAGSAPQGSSAAERRGAVAGSSAVEEAQPGGGFPRSRPRPALPLRLRLAPRRGQ